MLSNFVLQPCFIGRVNGGYSGDGGYAVGAAINAPYGLAFDTLSNLYITEVGNDVIRKVTSSTGIITTIAGTPFQQLFDNLFLFYLTMYVHNRQSSPCLLGGWGFGNQC